MQKNNRQITTGNYKKKTTNWLGVVHRRTANPKCPALKLLTSRMIAVFMVKWAAHHSSVQRLGAAGLVREKKMEVRGEREREREVVARRLPGSN